MYFAKKNLFMFNLIGMVLSAATLRGMDFITITSPLEASTAPFNPIVLSGTSSLSSAPVNVLLDGTIVATTTTDSYGNWQISYSLIIENGVHTFLVQLMAHDAVTVVASATVDVTVENTVAIIDPLDASYGTVSGKPLTIQGTSSLPNAIVRLTYDNIPASAAITDEYGNWNATYNLSDGNHIVIAQLSTPDRTDALVTDQVSFMVDNPDTITFTNPIDGGTASFNPIIISGASSLPLTTVHISLDGTLIATTTTDANGNWQTPYTFGIVNGNHTFLAQLIAYDAVTVLASTTITVTLAVPIILPSGKNQVRVVAGAIPTTGSGSGPGYSYTISGSIATINFTPAFDSSPSIMSTGLRSSGSSTVTVTSVSPTATNIAFSTGTQYINFTAALFS